MVDSIVRFEIILKDTYEKYTISNLCLKLPEISMTQEVKDILDDWLEKHINCDTMLEYEVTLTPRFK